MRRLAALPFVALTACGGAQPSPAAQSPDRLAAAFDAVIKGCSASISDAGIVDQQALAATGWRATERTTQQGTEKRTLPANGYAQLKSNAYEATTWNHPDHQGQMHLVRWGGTAPQRPLDRCSMQGQVSRGATPGAIVAALARRIGRNADRSGAVPRGGDFLTLRSDPARSGHYWALPRSDVYLETLPEGFASVELVAMPDRAALDRFSPERPESRIVSAGQESAR